MAAIKRIVLFKFKDATTDETIKKIFDGLAGLKKKIDGIEDFCSGAYSSTDGLNQGYTHAFIMTFKDEKSRDAFGPNEEHQKLVEELIGPNLDGVLAFDFLV
jgi:hypothetical protein